MMHDHLQHLILVIGLPLEFLPVILYGYLNGILNENWIARDKKECESNFEGIEHKNPDMT